MFTRGTVTPQHIEKYREEKWEEAFSLATETRTKTTFLDRAAAVGIPDCGRKTLSEQRKVIKACSSEGVEGRSPRLGDGSDSPTETFARSSRQLNEGELGRKKRKRGNADLYVSRKDRER